jgi:hypothetical protein
LVETGKSFYPMIASVSSNASVELFFWEESLSVVRKLYAQYALAGPFDGLMKVYWPKFKGELKSIPIIFSHNLLYLFVLQQFTQKLMGQ